MEPIIATEQQIAGINKIIKYANGRQTSSFKLYALDFYYSDRFYDGIILKTEMRGILNGELENDKTFWCIKKNGDIDDCIDQTGESANARVKLLEEMEPLRRIGNEYHFKS